MKKKILFVNPFLTQGGVEHQLITVLNNLDSEKYDITLFLYVKKLDLLSSVPDYVKVIIDEDKTRYYALPLCVIYFVFLKLSGLLGLKKAAEKYQKRLSAYRRKKMTERPYKKYFKKDYFDVIVSYSVHIGTEMALKIPGGKRYVFCHSSDPEYHRDINEVAFPQYDRVIAVSEGVGEVLKKAYPEFAGKIAVLKNFVDMNEIVAKSKEPVSLKSGLVLCSCGRLSHEKGYDMAVEAAKILRDRGATFTWYFVGDGAEREKLEAKISEYGLNENIVITGFLTNPYPYILNSDIFIQPSYEEAQPLSVLEALRLGTPIVSTDTVGGRVILEGGKKGIITDINATALADGIYSLITDEAKRKSFAKLYSEDENESEKKEFTEKWDKLLSL